MHVFTCERARRIESGLILVSVCESPAPCERPCVYRVVGRTVSIGRPLLPLHLLCACQRTELTGPALEREASKLSPTLSPPPSLSLSPPLAHSRLTFHSDNIQGPKPLLHLLSSSPSFRPSRLSHHASGNFRLHYGYPQHLQQHLLLLGGGQGRSILLFSSGERERNFTYFSLASCCAAVLLSLAFPVKCVMMVLK